MNRGNAADIIGINWGSSAFRAYRIDSEGAAVDSFRSGDGVGTLDRAGMEAMIERVVERWPGIERIYASGMIGSNIGWVEAPYAEAPVAAHDLVGRVIDTRIGATAVRVVPGIACRRRSDGGPDILRGEEIELFGHLAAVDAPRDGLVALPGTHTKWAAIERGRLVEFFTSISGELYDRMSQAGLLASIIDGAAEAGAAFARGVDEGRRSGLAIGTLLFGARARVIRGDLERRDAASYLRGLLIGAELADVGRLLGAFGETPVPLIGNGPLCRLYAAASEAAGGAARIVDRERACLAGFAALDQASVAVA